MNRVKLLGRQILEAYKSWGNAPPDQNIKASLERDMCKCFIRGLKPEIEQKIARDLEIKGTVSDALRIERELRSITFTYVRVRVIPQGKHRSLISLVKLVKSVIKKDTQLLNAGNCLKWFSRVSTKLT